MKMYQVIKTTVNLKSGSNGEYLIPALDIIGIYPKKEEAEKVAEQGFVSLLNDLAKENSVDVYFEDIEDYYVEQGTIIDKYAEEEGFDIDEDQHYVRDNDYAIAYNIAEVEVPVDDLFRQETVRSIADVLVNNDSIKDYTEEGIKELADQIANEDGCWEEFDVKVQEVVSEYFSKEDSDDNDELEEDED